MRSNTESGKQQRPIPAKSMRELRSTANDIMDSLDEINGLNAAQIEDFSEKVLSFFGLVQEIKGNASTNDQVDILIDKINLGMKKKSKVLSKHYRKIKMPRGKILMAQVTTTSTVHQFQPAHAGPIKITPRTGQQAANSASREAKFAPYKDARTLLPMLKNNTFIEPEAKIPGSGYKIHLGLTFKDRKRTPENEVKYAQALANLAQLLDRHRDDIDFKLSGLDLVQKWTDPRDEQRGKQVTIYVPEAKKDIIPVLVRELELYIGQHTGARADSLISTVAANDTRNIPLQSNNNRFRGVLSMRYSSAFDYDDNDKAAVALDDWERASKPAAVLQRAGKTAEYAQLAQRINAVVGTQGMTGNAVAHEINEVMSILNLMSVQSSSQDYARNYAIALQGIRSRVVGHLTYAPEMDSDGRMVYKAGIIRDAGPYNTQFGQTYVVKLEMLDGQDIGKEKWFGVASLSNNVSDMYIQ